jgi:hypothetical protein
MNAKLKSHKLQPVWMGRRKRPWMFFTGFSMGQLDKILANTFGSSEVEKMMPA